MLFFQTLFTLFLGCTYGYQSKILRIISIIAILAGKHYAKKEKRISDKID
jgi:hypothetical protein